MPYRRRRTKKKHQKSKSRDDPFFEHRTPLSVCAESGVAMSPYSAGECLPFPGPFG